MADAERNPTLNRSGAHPLHRGRRRLIAAALIALALLSLLWTNPLGEPSVARANHANAWSAEITVGSFPGAADRFGYRQLPLASHTETYGAISSDSFQLDGNQYQVRGIEQELSQTTPGRATLRVRLNRAMPDGDYEIRIGFPPRAWRFSSATKPANDSEVVYEFANVALAQWSLDEVVPVSIQQPLPDASGSGVDSTQREISVRPLTTSVTEGANAQFVVVASPMPDAPLTVNIEISAEDGFGVVTGSRTVTIGQLQASTTLAVPTVRNQAEATLSSAVTATVGTGDSYVVSTNASDASATVHVHDATRVWSNTVTAGREVADGVTLTGLTAQAGSFSRTNGFDYGNASKTVTRIAESLSSGVSHVDLHLSGSGSDFDGRSFFLLVEQDAGVQRFDFTSLTQASEEYRWPAPSDFSIDDGEQYRVMLGEDLPSVSIAPADDTVDEGQPAVFELQPSRTSFNAYTVNVEVSGTASYGVQAMQTVTVDVPASSAGPLPLSIDTRDNVRLSPDGTVTATVQSGIDYQPGATPSADVTIADNDRQMDPPVMELVTGRSFAARWVLLAGVSGFDLRYRQTGSGPQSWINGPARSASQSRVVLADLTPGASYELQVRPQASDPELATDWSESALATLDENVPRGEIIWYGSPVLTAINSHDVGCGGPGNLNDCLFREGGGRISFQGGSVELATIARVRNPGNEFLLTARSRRGAVEDGAGYVLYADGYPADWTGFPSDLDFRNAEYAAAGDRGTELRLDLVETLPPTAPQSLTLTLPTTMSLRARWTAPRNNNRPPVTGYELAYRMASTDEWTSIERGAGQTSANVEGLRAGRTYEFRVRARNADGDGLWSSIAEADTLLPPGVIWDATLYPATIAGFGYVGYHRLSLTRSEGGLVPNEFSLKDVNYTVRHLTRRSNETETTNLTLQLLPDTALPAAAYQFVIGDPPVVLNFSDAVASATTERAYRYEWNNVTLPIWGEEVLVRIVETRPTLSISAVADSITEGEAASFVVSADSAPDADLSVTVEVAGDGFGVTGGTRTVTISAGATSSSPFTVQTTEDPASVSLSAAIAATLSDSDSYWIDDETDTAQVTVHDLERLWSGEVSAGYRIDGTQTLTGYIFPSLGGISEPRQFVYGGDTITVTRISEELSDSGETFTLDLSGEGSSFNGRTFYLLVETSSGMQRLNLVGGVTQAGGFYRWASPSGVNFNLGSTYRVMLGEGQPMVTVEAVNDSVIEGQPAEFRVNIDKPPRREVVVKMRVNGSSAYGVAGGLHTLTFAAGDGAAKIISLTSRQNNVLQASFELTATLTDEISGALLGNPSSASVTLTDNDQRMAAPAIEIETRRSVLLTWQQREGESGYDFRYRRQGDASWTTEFTNRNVTTVNIDELSLGTYEFQARLRYYFSAQDSGVGQWSPTTTATLNLEDQGGAVIWFATLTVGGSNNVPSYGLGTPGTLFHGDLTNPTINHFGGSSTMTRILSGGNRSFIDFTATGGQSIAGASYRLYVDGLHYDLDNFPGEFTHRDSRLLNRFRWRAQLPLRLVERRLPLAPTELTVGTERANFVELSWTAPDNANRPGITGYELRYRLQDSMDAEWFDGPSATTTSGRVNGLTPGQSYDVQVRATNIDGSGLWSDSVTAMTNAVPSVRLTRNTGHLVFSGTTIQINGIASDAETATANLTYQWTQTSGPTVAIGDATASGISFTAPDVTADTLLIFRLTVTDELGDSGFATVGFTVAQGIPGAVWQSRMGVVSLTEFRPWKIQRDGFIRGRFGSHTHGSFTTGGTTYYVTATTANTVFQTNGNIQLRRFGFRLSGSPTRSTCPRPLNGKWILVIRDSDGSTRHVRFGDDGAFGGIGTCHEGTLLYIYEELDGVDFGWEPGEQVTFALVPAPRVSVTTWFALGNVDEGGTTSFRISTDDPVLLDTPITVTVAQQGEYIDSTQLGQRELSLPTGRTTLRLDIPTIDDFVDEVHGGVTVSLVEQVEYNINYGIGRNSATFLVRDNDIPPGAHVWSATLTAGNGYALDGLTRNQGYGPRAPNDAMIGNHGSLTPDNFTLNGVTITVERLRSENPVADDGSFETGPIRFHLDKPLGAGTGQFWLRIGSSAYTFMGDDTTTEYSFMGTSIPPTGTLQIELTQEQLAPTFSEGDSTTRELDEDEGNMTSATALAVGDPVVATDLNEQTLTYLLGGLHSASFTIDSATGQIYTRPNLRYDYEVQTSYDLTITADDGSNTIANRDTIDVTVNINDLSEPPLAPTLTVSLVTGHPDLVRTEWTEPEQTGRARISHYRMQYRRVVDTEWTDHPDDLSTTGRTTLVANLSLHHVYQFRVRGVSADGDGAWSNVVRASTNTPPSVTIADDQAEHVFSDETAQLRGIGTDAETAVGDLTYQWTQTAGPTAAIQDATSATASFTAPNVNADTTLTFTVTVTDEVGETAQAELSLTVIPGVERAVWQSRMTVGSFISFTFSERYYGFDRESAVPYGSLSHESFALQGATYYVSSVFRTENFDNESVDLTLRLSGSATSDTCPTPLNGKWALVMIHSDGSRLAARFEDDGVVGGAATCVFDALEYVLLDMPDLDWDSDDLVTLALVPAPTLRINPLLFHSQHVEGTQLEFRIATGNVNSPDRRRVLTDIPVVLRISQQGDFVAGGPGERTFVLDQNDLFHVFYLDTIDDMLDEYDGAVTVSLVPSPAYYVHNTLGQASFGMLDDDYSAGAPVWSATLTPQSILAYNQAGTFTRFSGFLRATSPDNGYGTLAANHFTLNGATINVEQLRTEYAVTDTNPNMITVATSGVVKFRLSQPLGAGTGRFWLELDGKTHTFQGDGTTTEYSFAVGEGEQLVHGTPYQVVLTQEQLPPSFDDGDTAARSIDETVGDMTSATPLAVGDPVAATDLNEQTLTYSLSGTHAASFSVDSASGQIYTKPNVRYDFEVPGDFSLTLTVDDGSNTIWNRDTIDVTVSLNDVSEPPQTPNLTVVTAADSDFLRASWTIPNHAGRPSILRHHLQYRLVGAASWTDFSTNLPANSDEGVTVSGLQSQQAYEVRVRAENADGPGPWSNTARASTNTGPTVTIAAGHPDTVFSGETVQLRSLGSDAETADDDLVYQWTQTAGPAVAIQDATSATASFAAPNVNADTTVTFRVTVTDEVGESSFAELSMAVWKGIPGAVWNSRMTVGHTMRSESATVTFDTYGYQRGSRGSLTHQRVNYRGTHYVTGLQYDRQTAPTGIIFLNLEFILSRSATGNSCATSFPRRDFYLVIANQDGTGSRGLNLRDFRSTSCNTPNFLTVYELPGHDVRWTDGQQLLVALVEVPRISIERLGFETETEGRPARFRISSHVPVPAALTVSVNVTVEGDYGITPGPRTVTIPAGQSSAELSLPTTNDEIDEHNGSVTVTLASSGNAYDVAPPPNNSVSTAIHDNDDPPGYLLWTAMLNAQSHTRSTGTETGYFAAPGGRVGSLAPDGFVFRGQSISVIGLSSRPPAGGGSSTLTFELSHSLGAGRFVLQIGNEQYRFEGNGGTSHSFANQSISVGPNQTVTLHQLQTPPSFNDRTRPGRRRNLAENVATQSRAAIAVGDPFTATDANPQQTLTYTMSGTDADKFSLDSATGQLRTLPNRLYDYEAGQTSYALRLTVNDGSGASNDRQSINVTIRLNDVAEPPLAPAVPTVAEVSGHDDRLSVSWTAPDNAGRPAITHYDLRYRVLFSGESGWTDGPQNLNVLSATISGLTVGANYEVQVRAVNAEGDGAWSPAGRPFNNPPTAEIADGLATTAFAGETVQLRGSGSDAETADGDLTYQWTQTAGPTAVITDATSATASFIAPAVSGDTNLTFRLTVTDEIGDTGHAEATFTIWAGIPGAFWQSRMTVASQRVGGDNPFSRRGYYFTRFEGFGFGSLTHPLVAYQGHRYLHWLFYRDDQTNNGVPQPDGPLTFRLSGHPEQEVLPGPWQGKLALVSAQTDGSIDNVVRFNATGTNSRYNTLLQYEIHNHGLPWADGNTVLVALVQAPTISIAPVADLTTEGQPARFRVSADRAAVVDLQVALSIAAEGEFGVATGPVTVTIPAGQTSVVHGVPTAGDDIDERHGSVTATLSDSVNYYTAASPGHEATVAVNDDDDPPGLVVWSATLSAGATVSGGVTFTGYNAAQPQTGSLVPASFQFKGDTYTVTSLRNRYEIREFMIFLDTVEFILDRSLLANTGPFTLRLDRPANLEQTADVRTCTLQSGTASFSCGDGQLDGAYTVTLTQQQRAPSFNDGDTTTRGVDEHIGTATDAAAVGNPVSAFDPNDQTLTYSLSGTDAASFTVDSTGQISTKAGLNFDYESGTTTYTVTVTVNDGSGASNDRDSIDVTITLNDVSEPPLAPAVPTVTRVAGQDDRLAVSWTAPDNTGRPAITHYDLRYRVLFSGESGWTDGPQDISGLSATITDLTPDAYYEIQVRAVNDEGDGAWSPAGRPFNNPPTAEIAAGQARTVFSADTVPLQGVGADAESAVEDLTYQWTQTAGPTVTITDATSATASFTAPEVSADTDLSFRLTVTDEGGDSGQVDLTITVWEGIPDALWNSRLTVGSNAVTAPTETFTRTGHSRGLTLLSGGFEDNIGSLTHPAIAWQGTRYVFDFFFRDQWVIFPGSSSPDNRGAGPLEFRLSDRFVGGDPNDSGCADSLPGKLRLVIADTSGQVSQVLRFDGGVNSGCMSGLDRGDFDAGELRRYQLDNHSLTWSDNQQLLVALLEAPTVSVEAIDSAVIEGSPVRFRVNADRALLADLAVTLNVAVTGGEHGLSSAQRTLTIAAGETSAELSLDTTGDSVDEAYGRVTATLASSDGFTTASSPQHAATVVVVDDDIDAATQVWRATLSALSRTAAGAHISGYSTSVNVGGLNPTQFHFRGVTYTVTNLRSYIQQAGGLNRVEFQLNRELVATGGTFTLEIFRAGDSRVCTFSGGGTQPDYTCGSGALSGTYTVFLTIPQQPPSFTEGDTATRSFDEHVGSATDAIAVGNAVSATDPNLDTLTYSLSGTDAASFTVDATGQISTKAGINFDYESGNTSYSVTLTADDGSGGSNSSDSIDVTITVDNASEPPLKPAAPSVAPATGDTAINTIEITATLPDNTGRPDFGASPFQARYRIDGAMSFTESSLQRGTTSSLSGLQPGTTYEIQVRASNSDGAGPWSDSSRATTAHSQTVDGVTVYVFNLPTGSSATVSALASDHVSRTPPAGKIFVSGPLEVAVTPALSGGQQVQVCVSGAGDLARHDGTAWQTLTTTARTIATVAHACADVSQTSPFAVLGDASNTAPSFNDGDTATRSIAENVGAATDDTAREVGNPLTATDPDTDDTLTYNLAGTDAASFTIDTSDGQISTLTTVNYDREAKAQYEVTVDVSDGNGGTDSITVTINLTNVSEPALKPAAPSVAPASGDTAINTIDITATLPDNTGRPDFGVSPFQARYRVEGAASFTVSSQQRGTTSSLSGLQPGKTYEIQVRASNSDGAGPWSDSGRATTAHSQTLDGVTVYVFNLPTGSSATVSALASDHVSRTPPAGKIFVSGPLEVAVTPALSGGQQVQVCVSGAGDLARHDGTAWQTLTTTARTIATVAHACADVSQTSPFAVLGAAMPSVTITASDPLTVAEDGGTATYQVVLGAQPQGDVTVTPSSSDTSVATVSDPLTFTTGNWDTAQAVTVTGVNDDIANPGGQRTVTVSHAVSGYGALTTAQSVNVVVTDDDPPPGWTELWRATMTVGDVISGSEWGFQSSTNSGALSSTQFTYNGTDYTVNRVSRTLYNSVKSANFHPGGDLGAGVFVLRLGEIDLTFGPDHSYPDAGPDEGPTIFAGTPASYWFRAHVPNVDMLDFSTGDMVRVVLYKVAGDEPDNTAPSFDDGESATRSIAENVGAAMDDTARDVGNPLTATDPDTDDTLTYSLTGTDASSFAIDTGDGQISTLTTVNYDREAKAQYEVTVEVSDGNGGTDSITVQIDLTNESEPPLAPTALTVSAVNDNTITVGGTAPDNSGRPAITSYEGQYRVDGSGAAFTDAGFSSSGVGGPFTNLVASTTYELQVRARNADGAGLWSDSLTAGTTGPPMASGTIPDVQLNLGVTQDVDVAPYFSGTVESYSVTTSDADKVAVDITGSTVDIEAVTEGAATITVTATRGSDTAQQEFTVTAVDPTPITVSISADSSAITEGEDAEFTVTASRAVVDGLTVGLMVAQTGADWGVSTGSASVTIDSGEASATLTLSTDDDSLDEGGTSNQGEGTITVNIATGDYTVHASAGSASMTIHDNDLMGISVTHNAGTDNAITEGESVTFTVTGVNSLKTLTVTRATGRNGDFNIGLCDGTITVGHDIGGKTCTISTSDDNVDEDDGYVEVSVGARPNRSSAGSARVQIRDNDERGVTLSRTSVSLGPDASGDYTIVLDSQPTASVTIAISSADTSRVTVSPASITFTTTNWNTARTVTVTRTGDPPPTTVAVSHTISGGDYGSNNVSASNVQVNLDDSGEPPLAPTGVTASQVPDKENRLDIAWTAPNNDGRPAILHYDLQYRKQGTSGWTNGPQDVNALSATIMDLVAETAYDVQVRAVNANGNGPWSDSATGTTVAGPVVTIAVVSDSVREGSDAEFRVTASRAPASELTVTANISAEGDFGVDTTATRGAKISVGQTSATFNVATAPDDVEEPDGSVTAMLASDTGYTLGDPSSATVTVRDDDGDDDGDDEGDGLNSPPRVTRIYFSVGAMVNLPEAWVTEIVSGTRFSAGYETHDRDNRRWDTDKNGIHDRDGRPVLKDGRIVEEYLEWIGGLRPLDPTGYGRIDAPKYLGYRWLVAPHVTQEQVDAEENCMKFRAVVRDGEGARHSRTESLCVTPRDPTVQVRTWGYVTEGRVAHMSGTLRYNGTPDGSYGAPYYTNGDPSGSYGGFFYEYSGRTWDYTFPVTFLWQQIEGPTVMLEGTTRGWATFRAPLVTADTWLKFKLTVTDPHMRSASREFSFTINDCDSRPTWVCPHTRANAGRDVSAMPGEPVKLIGTVETDPGAGSGRATLRWSQVEGPSVPLSGAHGQASSFHVPRDASPGTVYGFMFTATGQDGQSDSDLIAVTVQACAGADQTGAPGQRITLQVECSETIEGEPQPAFAWSQLSGPSVTLDQAAGAKPSFTIPGDASYGTTLQFQLTVTHQSGQVDTDTVVVTVVAPSPTACAGPDQSGAPGEQVTLQGRCSVNPYGAWYLMAHSWTQVSGPAVSLDDAARGDPTFTLPSDAADGTVLEFRLTVTDQTGQIDSDAVRVTVDSAPDPTPPTACAGPDQEAQPGDLVTLEGACSTNPHGVWWRMAHLWTQPAGQTIVLSDHTRGRPTFTVPSDAAPGTVYTFTLTVTDIDDERDSDDVTVTVLAPEAENRAPVFGEGAQATRQLAENSGAGVNVGAAVTAVDPDGDALTYSLSGPGASSFSIHSGTGQLITVGGVRYDYEAQSSYTLTVEARDGQGAAAGIVVTVVLLDVTEPTTLTACSSNLGALGQAVEYAGSWNDPSCRAHHQDGAARYLHFTLASETVVAVTLTSGSNATLYLSAGTPKNGWGTVPGPGYEHRREARRGNGKLLHDGVHTGSNQVTLTLAAGSYTVETAGAGDFTISITPQ